MKIITDRQLTDAAMELVTEKGYSETTTREIAERAGVNEVTLFRRFGGKKEIILKALEGDRWIPRLDVTFSPLPPGTWKPTCAILCWNIANASHRRS